MWNMNYESGKDAVCHSDCTCLIRLLVPADFYFFLGGGWGGIVYLRPQCFISPNQFDNSPEGFRLQRRECACLFIYIPELSAYSCAALGSCRTMLLLDGLFELLLYQTGIRTPGCSFKKYLTDCVTFFFLIKIKGFFLTLFKNSIPKMW